MQVKIQSTKPAADGIVAVELVSLDGSSLPPFDAGAHIDIQLPGGLTRQYSLCNDPSDRSRYVLGVLRARESRGGSVAVHALQQGDVVEISLPRNQFALASDAKHSILVAGGIGITPILSMAETLSGMQASFEMHYCVRDRNQIAFSEQLCRPGWQGKVFTYADSEASEARFNLDGVLDQSPDGTHLYVCGPGGFIEMVLERARQRGWSEARLHREYFAAPVLAAGDEQAFEIVLASSGKRISVAPDQTAVAALHAAGIDVPTSCEQGICGTCLTRVLEGNPEHRDMYLTDEERACNDRFLPCCSRAKSACLVLDL